MMKRQVWVEKQPGDKQKKDTPKTNILRTPMLHFKFVYSKTHPSVISIYTVSYGRVYLSSPYPLVLLATRSLICLLKLLGYSQQTRRCMLFKIRKNLKHNLFFQIKN